ncbi:MAG: hypothetical protein EA341_01585 [Mongoliibacter sp.]|uniref:hypothetical protein n=1 Tax=Mongoliibacter sp. TaxID=2022438 RepID=UPI0012F3F764|nr:hypothetical protein [Mongoliibacter sp.]TVP53129.1 MAG: hypothetical protein EA341_01585 [Mongoliibacter sp.]
MNLNKIATALLVAASAFTFSSCNDDEMEPMPSMPGMESFEYAFNEGQLLNSPETAYDGDGGGDHPRNLSAKLDIEEMENGMARVTVTLENGVNGLEYAVHAHDAADPSTTPNGTPYNETPNGDVFAGMISVSGGSGSRSVETNVSYDFLINDYEGFFVVHDPTQAISTTDLTTYLILGIFGQDLAEGTPTLRTAEFDYTFNEGQVLDNPDIAYQGEHPRDLTARITVEEKIDGTSSVTITLNNTLDGETYPVHAHDAADPATTPNGTPYNETPNGDIFAGGIAGNGGTVSASNDLEISFNELTRNYEGFFVVHDPTQELSTTDLTTYLILGLFAR